jgi:hypothetical protein
MKFFWAMVGSVCIQVFAANLWHIGYMDSFLLNIAYCSLFAGVDSMRQKSS